MHRARSDQFQLRPRLRLRVKRCLLWNSYGAGLSDSARSCRHALCGEAVNQYSNMVRAAGVARNGFLTTVHLRTIFREGKASAEPRFDEITARLEPLPRGFKTASSSLLVERRGERQEDWRQENLASEVLHSRCGIAVS